MKRRRIRNQHIIELLVTLVIIVLLNFIGSTYYYRFDLTSEKRYTLSPATKEILDSLDDIAYIKVYLNGELPAGFLRMKTAIRELLDEFRWYSPAKIRYDFIDPLEDQDPGIRRNVTAQLYKEGLQPTNIQVKQKDGSTMQKIIFPGAIISYSGVDVAVNLLKNNPGVNAEVNLNNSIQSLEYEFISMLRNLNSKQVEKVAFIEGHGELNELQTGDITKSLANFYQVDRGTIGGRYGCLNNYKAIIIAKPMQKFNESDKFVIDQYIMNGGKVLWFLDVVSVSLDSLLDGSTFAFYSPVNLDDQLFRYGVRINPDLVKDIQCHVIPVNKGLAGGSPQWSLSPWYYFPVISPSENNPITKSLNMIRLEFASSIDTVGETGKIRKEVLLATSPYTKRVQLPELVSLRESDIAPKESEYNSANIPVGVLLEGSFESVFKNRSIPEGVSGGPAQIRTSGDRTSMLVVSDGDIIRNEVVPTADGPAIEPLGYDRYTSQVFGNSDFILNAVNYMTDATGLITLRGRELKLRLLDRQKVRDEKLKWELINLVLPSLIIILAGLVINFYRKKAYR
jgi:gliding motility-associatede transport system auxiliary component